MKQCVECQRTLPLQKFNVETAFPDVCFGCRVKTVNVGFGGHRSQFNGSGLIGGTIASDNRHTVAEARANGYDPVPAGYKAGGVSSGELNRLKKIATL